MQHVISRGGIRLAYERRGRGPLVVLVQGLGMPGRMWLRLPGGLVKSGHTVVTPDARGTGASEAPRPPYTMRGLAADLAAVIDDVAAGPAIVVGISLGGMVVQHLALRWPDRVRGLILAATTCGLPHGKLPDLRFVALMLRSFGGDPAVLEALRGLLVHPQSLARRPELFAEWDRMISSAPTPWPAVLGQLSAAATHSTGFFLQRISCPTLVITGDHDRIIHPENSRILARRIPGAELEVLEDAGHAFPLERPAAIPRGIARIMQRSAAGADRPPAPQT